MNGILHSIYTKDGTGRFRLNLSGSDVPWITVSLNLETAPTARTSSAQHGPERLLAELRTQNVSLIELQGTLRQRDVGLKSPWQSHGIRCLYTTKLLSVAHWHGTCNAASAMRSVLGGRPV